ncbi:MAG: 2Fe-2S iron-sulfur cluster-binding protein [Desulfosoma sp.]|uniref:2Fe-2S iron-sulfur cluster-binding protein n=1 Tax=Desulfosoma sp. TaxID=2603217 RepID=UPI00404B54E6
MPRRRLPAAGGNPKEEGLSRAHGAQEHKSQVGGSLGTARIRETKGKHRKRDGTYGDDHVKINAQEVQVEEGATILDAAKKAGVYIPTLCYHPYLPLE